MIRTLLAGGFLAAQLGCASDPVVVNWYIQAQRGPCLVGDPVPAAVPSDRSRACFYLTWMNTGKETVKVFVNEGLDHKKGEFELTAGAFKIQPRGEFQCVIPTWLSYRVCNEEGENCRAGSGLPAALPSRVPPLLLRQGCP